MSGPAATPGPRIPWIGGVANSHPPSDAEVARRMIKYVLCALNPVAAALCLLTAFVVTRRKVLGHVRSWWLLIVGGAVTLAMLWVGAGHGYTAPWREIAGALTGSPLPQGATATATALAAERWQRWILGQVPLSVSIAIVWAGVVAWQRRRYQAVWREKRAPQPFMSGRAARRAHKEAEAEEVVKRSRARREQDQSPTAWMRQSAPFGIDPEGHPVRWEGAWFRSHIVVTGPTGYGKSTTLLRLVWIALMSFRSAGMALIVLDLKGDRTFARIVSIIARMSKRSAHTVSLFGSTAYINPLAHGTANEVVSRVMESLGTMREGGFSDAFHRTNGILHLKRVVEALDQLIEAGPAVTGKHWRRRLPDLASLMDVEELEKASLLMHGQQRRQLERHLQRIKVRRTLAESVEGMAGRVRALAETEAGRICGADEWVDVDELVRRGDVLILSLDAARDAESARAVGTMVIRDLTRLWAELDDEDWPEKTGRRAVLMLDEFSAIGGDTLRDCFERSRGGGGVVITSAQNDAAFSSISDEFAAVVWDNSDVHILHRQRSSAPDRAEHIGTESSWQETMQTAENRDPLGGMTQGTGVGTVRNVQAFIVHPDELKSLQTGQVVLVTPTGVHRVAVTPIQVQESEEPDHETTTDTETPPETVFRAFMPQPPASDSDVEPEAQAAEPEVEEWVIDEDGTRIPR